MLQNTLLYLQIETLCVHGVRMTPSLSLSAAGDFTYWIISSFGKKTPGV